MKKVIAISIIALFVGVGFQSAFAVEHKELPVKSKLVETSIRIHRANSITPYKVRLSEKESDKIDNIFDNLKRSLDSAVTDEEIDAIYDDAVESLYKLGLFPRMSFEKAKQFVKGDRQNLNGKSQPDNIGNADENSNCKILGQTTETVMYDLNRLIPSILLEFKRYFHYNDDWRYNLNYYNGGIGEITFGWHDLWLTNPSNGWVWTNGSNGVVRWDGEFIGGFGERFAWWDYFFEEFYYGFIGVRGFEGLFIDRWNQAPCYLGNAEHVRLVY